MSTGNTSLGLSRGRTTREHKRKALIEWGLKYLEWESGPPAKAREQQIHEETGEAGLPDMSETNVLSKPS